MSLNHQRQRQVMDLFLKKMKFSPVVSIQGPRQCGKSYFARELVSQKLEGGEYFSLDRKDTRDFATSNPRSFLEGNDARFLIIDEAQKVPDLFHEIKDIVDRKRAPGKFVLLGSTEFSLETKIRESLTGRLSKLRIFPFNLSETLKMSLNPESKMPFIQTNPRATRKELFRFLKNGGLPGIFGVKSQVEQKNLFSDWLRLTTERDLNQVQKKNLQSEVAYDIIESIARLEESSSINIAKALRLSPKKIQSYLSVLEQLFVVFSVSPTKESSGKKLYYLTDVGLLDFIGAPFEKKLMTWFYLEMSSLISYKGLLRNRLQYYQPARGTRIHFIYEEDDRVCAIKLIPYEKFDKRDFLVFDSFRQKSTFGKPIHCYALSGGLEKFKYNDIRIVPWESIV